MTEHRAMQEQLHQAQKMEAIGQLTGGVAHDFNNLLTVILGNLETIWRELPAENARLRRAVDQATRGAQRAATLTQQLLAFSRRQPLNPKPTDINRLVSGVTDMIRRTLSEDITIETVLAGGVWPVEIDSHQLESALLNLAVNSRDAMPEGGTLTIETANTNVDAEYAARNPDVTPGKYVVICVTDTGAGMTRDVMARAFDPFFTTKPLGAGTGLGLSQVFGFVKQSGGHIRLFSELGEGTTIKIYLPRLTGDVATSEPEVPVPEAVGRRTETILVVEDDDDVRRYSTETLRELGFSILEAQNGVSALRILDHHPEITLLFTDVGLPGINGRELVEEARRRRPELRVLFTTGYARNTIMHHGRLDPGLELLNKPFTRAQLANRIREVLDAPAESAPRSS
jgi:nitrogen-specific signal transduction histidine kinase